MVLRRWRRGNLDSFKRPTDNPAENPVDYADQQYDLVLRARQISKQDIYERDGPKHDAKAQPPYDPAVNPNVQVSMIHTILDAWIAR